MNRQLLTIGNIMNYNINIFTGPSKETLDDFVQMLWEENIPVIIMVTKLKEGGEVKFLTYLKLNMYLQDRVKLSNRLQVN